MVLRDLTTMKKVTQNEVGGRIRKNVPGEVVFIQFTSAHRPLILSQKVKGEERAREHSRQKKPQHVGSMTKGQGEYKRMLDRLDKVFQVMVGVFFLFVCFFNPESNSKTFKVIDER